MVKNIIDAHVHLLPAHFLGQTDPRFGIKMDTYGRKVLPNGIGAPFAPNYLQDSTFSEDTLIHVMDCSGVEKAVIMQALCFKMNEDIALAVKKYPKRLRGAAAIEPKDESCWDEIQEWENKGLSVLKFEMSKPFGYSHPNAYPHLKFDSDVMDGVFRTAGTLGMTVTIDTSPVGEPGYQVEALESEIKRNPSTKFVLCHLGFPWPNIESDSVRYARWSQMVSLARYGNVWFDIAALPSLFREERYPYREGVSCVSKFIQQYGNSKAIWGTDIPGTYVDATYQQMVEMYTRSGLFSDDDLDAIFVKNAQDVYFS